MRRLRILTVADLSPLDVHGGGERALWEVATRLAARGHAVQVLARAPHPDAARVVERDGLRVTHYVADARSLGGFLRGALLGARGAAGPLLAAGVDVLHVHQPLAGWAVLASLAGRGVPSLYTFHSPAPLEYRVRRRTSWRHQGGPFGLAAATALWALERGCLQRASRIHVLSDFSASLLWQLYRVPTDRLVKVPGGADVRRFAPAAERWLVRERLGLPVARPLLLTVRNLEPRMGLDVLLRAMDVVRRRVPEALLLIGGAGSLREELQALAERLGLDGHVRFLGFVGEDDLVAYYQAADFFVLPTRALEGFGLVTAEALACGTPVLGTPVGATPELLEPLDRRLLFAEPSAEAMADRIAEMLHWAAGDPAAFRRLRDASRVHAERCFSWDTSAAGMERALLEVAARVSPQFVGHRCVACGGALGVADLLYRGERYRRCARCGAWLQARVPSDPELRQWYDEDYPRDKAPERLDPSRREMLAGVMDRLARVTTGPGLLLDIGCAGGQLGALAASRGWRVVATDLSSRACVAARAVLGLRVVAADAAALPFRSATVDAITLVNVLDHGPRALDTLREARRVLRPGGWVLVRVPNGPVHAAAARVLTSLGPVVRRRRWDVYPVLHVAAFGRRALLRLFERAGLERVVVANSPLASAAGAAALGVLVGGTAAVVARATGGRALIGPSLEVHARRPAGAMGDRP